MLRQRTAVVMLLIGSMLTIGPAFANAGQTVGDTELRTRIVDRLDDKRFDHVTVQVINGVATLEGHVASLWLKEQAVEKARKTKRVASVVDRLVIVNGESDEAVRNKVATKIRRYVSYTIFDSVDIDATDGRVALTGFVSQPYKVNDIGRLASQVMGVQTVDNRIETLPASIFDAQLRTELAVRIYNHSLFSSLAFQPQPPLHIVVKNSRVILTGVVNSEVQRKSAEHIVLGTFGVLSVDNRLKLDSETT